MTSTNEGREFVKQKMSMTAIAAMLILHACDAKPTIVGARAYQSFGNPSSATSLSLPSGCQLYVYGMATGGAAPSNPIANGQTIELKDANGNISVTLATSTSHTNNLPTGTAYHVFGGFGVSGFNFAQGFYGTNPGPGLNLQASVQFTLSAPALVVVIGLGSSQGTLSFSGLDNPTVDVPSPSSDSGTEDLSIEHEYLEVGTYTLQETTGPTPGSSPANEVDLIGVLVFSDQPNVAVSNNPQIPISPISPQSPATKNGNHKPSSHSHISLARYIGWSVAVLAIIGMAITVFRLATPHRNKPAGNSH